MSGAGARPASSGRDGTAGRGRGADGDHPKTPAQWYCWIFGATLLLAGLLGFIANSSFDTGRELAQGDKLIFFEVNGWHNIVHIASGLFLLALSPKRASARLAAISFGLVYAVVTIIGLVDGSDVLNLIPINPADNILHIAISALGIISGLMSKSDYEHGGDAGVVGTGGRERAASA